MILIGEKITLLERLWFPKMDFQCVIEYFRTNSWCILVNIFWIIVRLEKQLVNYERWRICQIPIFNLSRLEILLKNLDGHFDLFWTATIRLIFKYEMYLCSGWLATKYHHVTLLVSPLIWVYFQRVCTATPCIFNFESTQGKDLN